MGNLNIQLIPINMEKSKIEGVLLGLKICKELWAQGQLTHETIYENEVLYKEELASFEQQEAKANFELDSQKQSTKLWAELRRNQYKK